MSSINHGCANVCTECSDNARFRTWLHRFHPSFIICDSNYGFQLKIGVAFAMGSSQCAVEIKRHKENISSPRFLGLAEDLQHVHNYEMNIENENNVDVTATVIPTLESRKRSKVSKTLNQKKWKKSYVLSKTPSSTWSHCMNHFRKSTHLGMSNFWTMSLFWDENWRIPTSEMQLFKC